MELTITVRLPSGTNFSGSVPRLAKVDVICGRVTGAVVDRDAFSAPDATVAATFELPRSRQRTVRFRHVFTRDESSFYLRLRGSDGRDPWQDLWFYANPIFVTLA